MIHGVKTQDEPRHLELVEDETRDIIQMVKT